MEDVEKWANVELFSKINRNNIHQVDQHQMKANTLFVWTIYDTIKQRMEFKFGVENFPTNIQTKLNKLMADFSCCACNDTKPGTSRNFWNWTKDPGNQRRICKACRGLTEKGTHKDVSF